MHLGIVRLDLQGYGVARDRLLMLPVVIKDIAKVVMRLGIVRLDLQGFGIACDRLLMLPKIIKSIS